MTGDLQPLDVNFNWPFKAKYKEKLFILKMLSEEDIEDVDEDTPVQMCAEKNKRVSRNGHEYHIECQSDEEQENNRTHEKVTRNQESAYQVKPRAIEAINQTYKEMREDHILTSWGISGRNVMKDFYRDLDDTPVKEWNGYNRAWEDDTQELALEIHSKGKMFFEGMSSGVSDIESKLQFIPVPGRKKRKPQQEVVEDEVEMEEAETTECSDNVSEYSSGEIPDIDDSEDELAEFMGDCTLGGDEA